MGHRGNSRLLAFLSGSNAMLMSRQHNAAKRLALWVGFLHVVIFVIFTGTLVWIGGEGGGRLFWLMSDTVEAPLLPVIYFWPFDLDFVAIMLLWLVLGTGFYALTGYVLSRCTLVLVWNSTGGACKGDRAEREIRGVPPENAELAVVTFEVGLGWRWNEVSLLKTSK